MPVPEYSHLTVVSQEAHIPHQIAPPNATPSSGVLECQLAQRPDGVDALDRRPSLARPYVDNPAGVHEGPECTPPSVPVYASRSCLGGPQDVERHTLPSLPRSMRYADELVRDYLALHPYTSADSGRHTAGGDAVSTWSYQRLIAEFVPSLLPARRVRAQLGRQVVRYSVEQPDPNTPALVYIADGRTDERMQAVAAGMAWGIDPTTSLTVVSHQSVRAASLQAVHDGGRVPTNLHAEILHRDADQIAAIVRGHSSKHCTVVGVGSGAAVAAAFAARAAEREPQSEHPTITVGHVALLGIPGGRQRAQERIDLARVMSGLDALQERRVARAYRRGVMPNCHSARQALMGGLRTGLLRSASGRYVTQSLSAPPDVLGIALNLATATRYGGTTVALGAADTRTSRSTVSAIRAAYLAADPSFAGAVVERFAAGGLILGGREEALAVSPRVIAAMLRSMLP